MRDDILVRRARWLLLAVGGLYRRIGHLKHQPCGVALEQQRLIRRVANIEQQHRMVLLLDIDQLLDTKELNAASKAAK